MTNDELMTNDEHTVCLLANSFVIPHSSVAAYMATQKAGSNFIFYAASSLSSHLPIFHEIIWDFLEKTRGPLEDVTKSST
jgi:hypothetical protein